MDRRVATIRVGTTPAGRTRATWDGRRADGRPAPNGVYCARLVAEGRAIQRRFALLR